MWEAENKRLVEAELEPLCAIGLHEARHTFASLMIGAGVNAKALSTLERATGARNGAHPG